MATLRVWSLSSRMRLGIVLFVAAYLLATRPWSSGGESMGHYQVALAFLMMAAYPRGTRLSMAVGITVGVLALVTAVVNLAGGV